MLFTIAIPTYNNQDTIEKVIECAMNQKYDNDYEILVVNNASTDNTLDILNKYKDQIRIVSNDKTVSMYDNHNVCLENAMGDYIVFCHADDNLSEDALAILAAKLEERLFPQKYIVFGRSMFRDFFVWWERTGQGLNTVVSGRSAFIPFYYSGLTPSGTCYSKKTFLDAGGFIVDNDKVSQSDKSTMLYLACQGFEFEMIDRLLFIRTFASTFIDNATSYKSLDFAMEKLFSKLTHQQQEQIVNTSLKCPIDPIKFHMAIVKFDDYYATIQRYYKSKGIRNRIRLLSDSKYRKQYNKIMKRNL